MKKIDDKILERVRRLLAMAKDASSPNEAAIAAKRAQKLMEEHNLENIESILKDLEDDDSVDKDSVTDFKVMGKGARTPRSVPGWANQLSVAVARLFDCEVRIEGFVPVRIVFHGYKTDLAVCKWTFEYLIEQIRKFNANARKRYDGDRTLLGDYRLGLITGILEIVNEAREAKEAAQRVESSAGSASRGLVLVKKDAIVKKFGDQFKYRPVKGKSVNPSAWGDGVEDGRSVKLSQPLGGPDRQKQIKGG